MNIIVAFTYIALALLLAAVTYGVIYSSLYGSHHSLTPNTPKGLKTDNAGLASYKELAIQVAIGQPLSTENYLLMNSFEDSTKDGLLANYKWKENSEDFAALLLIMENIIRSYDPYNDTKDELAQKVLITNHFIQEIDKALQSAGNPIEKIPWGKSEIPFSVILPRFLASYLIMTTKNTDLSYKTTALSLMKKLVPSYNTSLGKTYVGYMAVFTAVPYLITQLVESPDKFKEKLQSSKIISAHEFMNPKLDNGKQLKEGVWMEDLAYTVKDLEFSYTPIMALHGFYARAWLALGLDFGGRAIFKNALEKLLHPNINVIPQYAFWGYCSIYNDFRAFGARPLYGINVYPSVGVGIYKNNQMYFHIRVQKPKQTIIPLSEDKHLLAAAIAVQSRKIYFARDLDLDSVTCSYNNHPGILWNKKNNDCTLIEGDDKKIVGDDNTHSFIGIIDGALVWLNQYECKEIADCKVYEIGLIDAVGLFQYYEIVNSGSDPLLFRTTKANSNDPGDIEIPAGETKKFQINQPINLSFKPLLKHIEQYKFSFRTPTLGDLTVTYMPKDHLAILKGSKRTYLMNASPKARDSLTYDGVQYERDVTTMTYISAEA